MQTILCLILKAAALEGGNDSTQALLVQPLLQLLQLQKLCFKCLLFWIKITQREPELIQKT